MSSSQSSSSRSGGLSVNYKILPALLWASGLILFAHMGAACASRPTELGRVRLKMDKAEVLEVAGSPKQTFRENNRDNWIYVYTSEKREWSRVVTFADGKVVKVSRPTPKDSSMRELEETDSLEEYEAKARSLQKSRSSSADKFQTIDGSND